MVSWKGDASNCGTPGTVASTWFAVRLWNPGADWRVGAIGLVPSIHGSKMDRNRKLSVLASGLCLAAFWSGRLQAQDSVDASPRAAGHHALNLGVHDIGLSIGNSRRWTGLRLNFQDQAVNRVAGVNFTIWSAKHNETMRVDGLALGLAGPVGGRFNGVSVGVVGAVAENGFRGITLASIGVVSNGDARGINVAGVGLVAQGDLEWVNIAGLGTVANRSMRGLSLAGLGVVAQGGLDGINLSGLGTVAEGRLRGIHVGGLGVVGNRAVRGVSVGGLAVVSNGDVSGAAVGGLAVVGNRGVRGLAVSTMAAVSDGGVDGVSASGLAVVGSRRIRGLGAAGLAVVSGGRLTGLGVAGLAVVGGGGIEGVAIGGVHVEGPWITGLAVSPIRTRTWNLHGVSIAGYNRIKGDQFGLSIGLYNYARRLHGVQLGLINNARNNHGLLRVLPFVNVHLH